MSFLFGSTKMPATQTVASPTVTETIPTVEEATEEEKKKLKKGKEKRSTILTSERGVLEPANVGLKTLLGE